MGIGSKVRVGWKWGWLGAAAGLGSLALPVSAADNFTIVVDEPDATGGKAISALGYKPDLDGPGPDVETIYTGAFGFTGSGTNAAMRKITGFNPGETISSVPLISEAQLRFYYGDGSSNATVVGATGPGAIMLNPQAVGTGPGAIPAYSQGWLADAVTVDSTPGKSDRLSRYTLNVVTSNADALGQITNLVNLDDITAISGGTSSNASRRGAWSGDGQFIYYNDSIANQSGGIWRVDALTGALQRLASGAAVSTSTEVGVLPAPGGGDRILFQGNAASGNPNGINYIDYDGGAAGTPAVNPFASGAALVDFLDTAVVGRSTTVEATSIVTVPDGAGGHDVYFMEDTADVLVKLDAAGRLVKVHSKDERAAVLGSVGSSNLDLIAREVTTPGGFTATQILFDENSTNRVIGATVYKAGDFDRDNDVDAGDRSAFLGALAPRLAYDANAATPAPPLPAVSKYDLNGNHTVDWKDVKILQSFAGFQDGDANLDMMVDFADLDLLRDNYYTVAGGLADKTWAQGDFASLDPAALVYLPEAADANVVNFVDLQVIADTWLNVLSQPNLTPEDLDARGYAGQFRQDVVAAFGVVPEPAAAAALLPVGLALLAGRRRR